MTDTTQTAALPKAGMLSKAVNHIPTAIAIVASTVFLDSLRFKFTNAPETQEIFGRLNGWAASLGADGLFAQTGLFSQYVIGAAELVAASLLLIGIHPAFRRLQVLGALIAVSVMSGAISFHLFTPLGIDPNNDGGLLFVMACVVWAGSITMLVIRRKELLALGGDVRRALLPNF